MAVQAAQNAVKVCVVVDERGTGTAAPFTARLGRRFDGGCAGVVPIIAKRTLPGWIAGFLMDAVNPSMNAVHGAGF